MAKKDIHLTVAPIRRQLAQAKNVTQRCTCGTTPSCNYCKQNGCNCTTSKASGCNCS